MVKATPCPFCERRSQGGKDNGFHTQRGEGDQYLGDCPPERSVRGNASRPLLYSRRGSGLNFRGVMTAAFVVLSLFAIKP